MRAPWRDQPAVTADDELCDAELELNKLPTETDAGFGGNKMKIPVTRAPLSDAPII